jgi:uncharacterized protein YaaN involved in tellurite resistance
MGDSLKIGKTVAGADRATGVAAPAPEQDSPAASESSAPAPVPPEPVALVEEPQVTGAVKLDATTLAKLDRLVAAYVVAIASLGIKDAKFRSRVGDIHKLGDEEIKASAQASSRLLDRPVGSTRNGGVAASATVSTGLLQLRRLIDELDPGHQGDLFGTRKLLGFIPFGDRLQTYFGRYESSQTHVNAILSSLQNGRTELGRENDDLEREKENLWQTMDRLRQCIYLAQKLDASLTDRIAMIEVKDPQRTRILREDMLFYVRQRLQDLTAQLAVSVQGYLAIDVIRANNHGLMRGVDRATAATVVALRTSVVVAAALGDQKLVLDQITALTASPSSEEGAAASTMDLAGLQAAFDRVYATLDEVDAFKLKALDAMTQTIGAVRTQADRARLQLERTNAGDAAAGDEKTGAASAN